MAAPHQSLLGAYYDSENFTQTNVLASDLGITAKGGNDNSMFVAVADLRGERRRGKVEFFIFQQQLIGSAKTNGDGIAELKLDKKPFLIIAKKEKMKGYLKTADGNALSLSRFDVAGEVAQKGLKGFLYGDRGVWQDQETASSSISCWKTRTPPCPTSLPHRL